MQLVASVQAYIFFFLLHLLLFIFHLWLWQCRSFIFSVDMAHAVHPNYSSKHERMHSPRMNAGMVIKTNDNQRYTTNGVSGFFVRELARRANVPVQEFMVRNDCPCGSTIGPM